MKTLLLLFVLFAISVAPTLAQTGGDPGVVCVFLEGQYICYDDGNGGISCVQATWCWYISTLVLSGDSSPSPKSPPALPPESPLPLVRKENA